MKNHLTRVTAAALLIGLSGCATTGASTPEQAVEARAKSYWDARVKGQTDKAYSLLAPSYKAVRTLDQYKAKFGTAAMIKSFEVAKVTCEPLKCTATLKLGVQAALASLNLPEIATYVDEVWLLEDGSWWRYEEL
ncbi:MAG: hypothetical protein HEQ39_03475 [Rhizobacter sp.]